MYTKNQFRTVQRIFVETQKRFPTSEDMEKFMNATGICIVTLKGLLRSTLATLWRILWTFVV